MNARATVWAPGSRLVLLFCTAAALFEGFDNQSMGVAAPRLLPEFGLNAGQASVLFSATTLGLFIGAGLGGRVADRIGRRQVLALSMALFGLCSLLTSAATGPLSLGLARTLTGLGLGGAMPNFISLSSEAVPEERRVSYVTIVMAAMPMGGLLAGITALGQSLGFGWRVIFYLGGLAPLLLSAAMVLLWSRWKITAGLAKANPDEPASHPLQSVTEVLFGSDRGPTSLLLWGGFFFTQLVLLLMLNWLPSLFIGLGFSHLEASLASMCFNFCGACGAIILGRLHAGAHRRQWVILTYAGMVLALAVLPLTRNLPQVALVVCGIAGIFIIGAQLILFALAPLYYAHRVRSTGVGAAVAIGRLGSVVGPLYAGALLMSGGGSATVLLGTIPAIVIGGASSLALCWRRTCSDEFSA